MNSHFVPPPQVVQPQGNFRQQVPGGFHPQSHGHPQGVPPEVAAAYFGAMQANV